MVLDLKALIYLAEKRYEQAEQCAQKSTTLLANTERRGWLGECLITLGTVLGRMGKSDKARVELDRAIAISEEIGDTKQADKARITIIQELPVELPEAFDLFLKSQDSFLPASKALIHRIEAESIRDALKRNNNSVYEAAREFDITRQGLAKRIETMFPHLTRKPKRTRRWKAKPR
jgi:tetratricopeptide (TPR) repeat protein